MTTAILLISEQTLPNLLFLLHLEKVDRIVFLTTERMERDRRGDWIIKAAGMGYIPVQKIVMDPENVSESLQSLSEFDWPEEQIYQINLTGGTKMMALATFAFFSDKENTHIYYIPFGTNILHEIDSDDPPQELNVQLRLQQYLASYGSKIIAYNQDFWEETKLANKVFNSIGNKNRNETLWKVQNADHYSLSGYEKVFYSGRWLEVWTAWAIHAYWGIPKEHIFTDVKIQRIDDTSNFSLEYDVVFMKDNRLYAGECKYFRGEKFTVDKINKELFKFASMNARLGLNVKPFFSIANDFSIVPHSIIETIEEYCTTLRLRFPADYSILSNREKFVQFMDKV